MWQPSWLISACGAAIAQQAASVCLLPAPQTTSALVFAPLLSIPPHSLCLCLCLLSSGAVGCAPESRPPFGFAHFCEEVTFFALRFTINYFIGELLSVYISSAPARCLKLPRPLPPSPVDLHTHQRQSLAKNTFSSPLFTRVRYPSVSLSSLTPPRSVCFLHISVNFICQRDAYVMCLPKKTQNKSNNNKIIIII